MPTQAQKDKAMQLGAFSVSLAVKDIAASREFYEVLGFEQVGGDPAQNWLILRNGETTIGLFQRMLSRTSSRSIRGGRANARRWNRSKMFARFKNI